MSASTTATLPVAFWLVPAAADHGWLTERIIALGTAHDGPRFEPHITLHVGDAPATQDIDAVLARVAAATAPLTLTAAATGQTDAYYQTLFITFDRERQDATRLPALQQALVAALQPPDPAAALAAYPLNPHLSLLYGRLPVAARIDLCRAEHYAGRSIAFDTIAAIRPADGFTDLSRVDRWQVFGHRRLTGS